MTYHSQSGGKYVEQQMKDSGPCPACIGRHVSFDNTLDLAVSAALQSRSPAHTLDSAVEPYAPARSSYEYSERMEVPSPCSCDCHNVSFGSGEARSEEKFDQRARSYFENEGKELAAYLKDKGRKMYELVGIGYESLDDAVAGVKIQGDKAKLVGNLDYESKVSMLARSYGVSKNVAERYVLDHEHAHLWQKNLGLYDDPKVAELDVENNLVEFYTKKAGENPSQASVYSQLRNIALHRSSSVARNYGGKAAVNYN